MVSCLCADDDSVANVNAKKVVVEDKNLFIVAVIKMCMEMS